MRLFVILIDIFFRVEYLELIRHSYFRDILLVCDVRPGCGCMVLHRSFQMRILVLVFRQL